MQNIIFTRNLRYEINNGRLVIVDNVKIITEESRVSFLGQPSRCVCLSSTVNYFCKQPLVTKHTHKKQIHFSEYNNYRYPIRRQTRYHVSYKTCTTRGNWRQNLEQAYSDPVVQLLELSTKMGLVQNNVCRFCTNQLTIIDIDLATKLQRPIQSALLMPVYPQEEYPSHYTWTYCKPVQDSPIQRRQRSAYPFTATCPQTSLSCHRRVNWFFVLRVQIFVPRYHSYLLSFNILPYNLLN